MKPRNPKNKFHTAAAIAAIALNLAPVSTTIYGGQCDDPLSEVSADALRALGWQSSTTHGEALRSPDGSIVVWYEC